MTRNEAIKVLRTAYASLPAVQRRRLYEHGKRGTRINCGTPAARKNYFDENGFG